MRRRITTLRAAFEVQRRVQQRFIRQGQAGLTFVEVVVAVGIIALSFGSVLFALTFSQRLAAESRNQAGAAEMINGLGELALASPFNVGQQDDRDQPRGVANVLKLTDLEPGQTADPQITNSVVNDTLYRGDRTAFSLMQLNTIDGTQQTTYELPIYASADTGVIQAFDDGQALEIIAEVTRTVSWVDNTLPVNGSGDTDNGQELGVRRITWTLEYEYLGETRQVSTSVLRATSD